MIEDAFKQYSTFNPSTSEKMNDYMKSNPNASVDEVINNIEELARFKKEYEDKIKQLIKNKEETIRRLQEQAFLSQRMQSRLDQALKEFEKLKSDLETQILSNLKDLMAV